MNLLSLFRRQKKPAAAVPCRAPTILRTQPSQSSAQPTILRTEIDLVTTVTGRDHPDDWYRGHLCAIMAAIDDRAKSRPGNAVTISEVREIIDAYGAPFAVKARIRMDV